MVGCGVGVVGWVLGTLVDTGSCGVVGILASITPENAFPSLGVCETARWTDSHALAGAVSCEGVLVVRTSGDTFLSPIV